MKKRMNDENFEFPKQISLLLEQKEEEIIICRNGTPVVSMKAYDPNKKARRIGIEKREAS